VSRKVEEQNRGKSSTKLSIKDVLRNAIMYFSGFQEKRHPY